MLTLLIPVDGSDYSRRAVDYAIRRAAATQGPTRVHLLNVQAPIVTVNVKLFVSQESLETYYREEGTKALADTLAVPARRPAEALAWLEELLQGSPQGSTISTTRR